MKTKTKEPKKTPEEYQKIIKDLKGRIINLQEKLETLHKSMERLSDEEKVIIQLAKRYVDSCEFKLSDVALNFDYDELKRAVERGA